MHGNQRIALMNSILIKWECWNKNFVILELPIIISRFTYYVIITSLVLCITCCRVWSVDFLLEVKLQQKIIIILRFSIYGFIPLEINNIEIHQHSC